ncbi:MAG: mandelate racemase/muconate lactonizing enzyme family protein [Chloroflexota bacterium]
MEITDVQTILLLYPEVRPAYSDAQHHFGPRSGVSIRVQTDTGVAGYGYVGFGVSGRSADAVKALIDLQLTPVLLGQDPFLPRQLRAVMWDALEYSGIEGVAHFALTGMDVALWDIMARALNVPGWKLLGACRDRIPAYAMVGWYYDDDANLDRFKRAIATAMAEEMGGVKIKVAGGPLEEDLQRIEVARGLMGPGVPLMVDANQVLDRVEALRRGRAYEAAGAYWFEEPLRPHDKPGYAQLCQQLDIPVAAGANEYTKYHVQELLAAGGCDILQPDLRRTGGPSEWIEIAGLAAAQHVPIASHGGDGATTHLLMATPSAIWCETGGKPKGPGTFTDHARIEGGYVYAPETPGFGMQVRDAVLERYGVKS